MRAFLKFTSDGYKEYHGGSEVPETVDQLNKRCLQYANEVLDAPLTLDEAKMLAIS